MQREWNCRMKTQRDKITTKRKKCECKETKKVRLVYKEKTKDFHSISTTYCCSVNEKTFIFVKKIGEGGYSSVYHVFDENNIFSSYKHWQNL